MDHAWTLPNRVFHTIFFTGVNEILLCTVEDFICAVNEVNMINSAQVAFGNMDHKFRNIVPPLLFILLDFFHKRVIHHHMYEMCIYDTVRFGQLKKDLPGITNTMLTKSLRELEEDGLIHREQFNEIPPHVEYSLTEMGRDLLPVFYAIMNWGFKHEEELYGNTEDK